MYMDGQCMVCDRHISKHQQERPTPHLSFSVKFTSRGGDAQSQLGMHHSYILHSEKIITTNTILGKV